MIGNFSKFLDACPVSIDNIADYSDAVDAAERIKHIISSVNAISGGAYSVDFDISLVRGQGYYTGTVFEIESRDFRGAIGGGGRYDNLIGKFTGTPTPAVGFSIGFERIFGILKEQGAKASEKSKIAVIYDEGDVTNAIIHANTLRDKYDVAILERANKLGKQLARLEERGFVGYATPNGELKLFEDR